MTNNLFHRTNRLTRLMIKLRLLSDRFKATATPVQRFIDDIATCTICGCVHVPDNFVTVGKGGCWKAYDKVCLICCFLCVHNGDCTEPNKVTSDYLT